MEPERPSAYGATPLAHFSFCVDQPATYLSSRDPQWIRPLPLIRPTGPPTSEQPESAFITYGDYFNSVQDFLADRLGEILHALEAQAQPSLVHDVVIHLVKHGALYHPAKVTVRREGRGDVCFVVNVAAGKMGRAAINGEAAHLRRLSQGPLDAMVPRVLAVGNGATEGRPPMPMFAAQWLDGFAEFHISGQVADPRHRTWTVWDENGEWEMSPDQVRVIHRRAAFILSCAYNPLTFDAVLDWHHAAGDFIIQKSDAGIDVRLISVRRYAPLVQSQETENITLNDLLDGVMLFLLDLTLRMRLDRLDGTGPMAWVEDEGVVPATWEGFIRGLQHSVGFLKLPSELVDGAIRYAAAHSVDDLINLGEQVVARMIHLHEERNLIQCHLPQHAADLKNAMDEGADEGDYTR